MMQKRLVTLASVVIVGIMVSMAWQQAAKSSDNNKDVKKSENPPPKEDRRQVEVSPEGYYVMQGRKMQLNEVEGSLVQAFRTNPKLAVVIRADRNDKFGKVSDLLDVCNKHGIQNIGFASRKEK